MINGALVPHGARPHRSATVAWQAHRATVMRLVRYSAVSMVATITSLVTLGMLVGLFALPAMWSNVVATAVGTVPSFELNRRWVWGNRARRSLMQQVIPFCALSAAGLVLSTVAVGVVSAHTSGWSRVGHTAAVVGANAGAYGTLWIVQYQLLHRVLFGNRETAEAVAMVPVFTAGGQTTPSSDAPECSMLHEGRNVPTSLNRGGNDHG